MSIYTRIDGRVHVRCPECGRPMSFPAQGLPFVPRCPGCMHAVPLPADASPPRALGRNRTLPPILAAETINGRVPQGSEEPANESVLRLVGFLNRQNERMGHMAVAIMHGLEVPRAQKHHRLLSLREDKNSLVRKEIDKIVRELDEEIDALARHPIAGQAAIQARLHQKRQEKMGLMLFLEAIFGLRLAATDTRPPVRA